MSLLVATCRKGRVAECLLATKDTLDSASLFCSPEALIEDKWRDALEKPGFSERVCAVAVDEAHCVSKWYVHYNQGTSLNLMCNCIIIF